MSIYVGNLSFAVTEQDLKTAFAQYGAVKQVKLPIDRETGKKRGFAFVEMNDGAEEAKAIKKLDGGEWMGKTLTVNKAKPRVNRMGGDIIFTGSLF
ncbi:RNA recognition motif domain-containing protein [Acaryochloris marina NIES-2412]|uniref:RNA recognition motif domain-containing protein n=1 Tax=Acaryochloris marina TaxID=155978 RepID=UPI004058AB81